MFIFIKRVYGEAKKGIIILESECCDLIFDYHEDYRGSFSNGLIFLNT